MAQPVTSSQMRQASSWWGTQWFPLPWPRNSGYTSIAQKELLPIVIACIVWGRSWKRHTVVAHCDNTAAVEVVNSGYSKDGIMMHLLRMLFFVKTHWEIVVRAEHILGRLNGRADAISRNNMVTFFAQAPMASRTPVRVSPEVTRLLMTSRPDWMSSAWSQQRISCLKLDWPTPQDGPIDQGRNDTSGSVRRLVVPRSQ